MFISLVTVAALWYSWKTTYICKMSYSFTRDNKGFINGLWSPCNNFEPFTHCPPGFCGPRPWALECYTEILDTGSWFMESNSIHLFSGPDAEPHFHPQSLEFRKLISSAGKRWWSREASGCQLGGNKSSGSSFSGRSRQEAIGLRGLSPFAT